MNIGAYKFNGGKQVAVILPVAVRDFHEAIRETFGEKFSHFKVLDPMFSPETYESAYAVVTSTLSTGEALTVLDRGKAKVSFFTPKREAPAWSAWIRVIELMPSPVLMN